MNVRVLKTVLCVFCVLIAAAAYAPAQAPKAETVDLPEVIRVDDLSIKPILVPNGKPLLVNFWATWCIPCVEEFPLLVEIHSKYKDRIDFITISLDDLAEIKRGVPKFLQQNNASMPAYLLYTKDENAVIGAIAEDWAGGLPFTVLYAANGEKLYTRQGIVKTDVLFPKIEEALPAQECTPEDPELN